MANSATQNPANKVGRNSGGGPAGVSEVVPTAAEAERGLQPLSLGGAAEGSTSLRVGIAAALVLAAGATTYAVRRARQPRGRFDRLQRWVRRK